jgi:HD-GYP domain-containing protein (c-di-GMP phosphodiesterase class II)
VPELAYGHHEKLDGSGYPRGLAGDDIPLGVRIMTIVDIFDALTASDRPYKKTMPVERALGVLEAEAREGKLDASLVRLWTDLHA